MMSLLHLEKIGELVSQGLYSKDEPLQAAIGQVVMEQVCVQFYLDALPGGSIEVSVEVPEVECGSPP